MTNKETLKREEYWYEYAKHMLFGKKIIYVGWQHWDTEDNESQTGLVFETEDNVVFFLSSDDEGNGPGALHWSSAKPTGPQDSQHGTLPVGVMDIIQLQNLKGAENEINNKRNSKEVG